MAAVTAGGDIVLALNSGSSSVKFGVYAVDAPDCVLLTSGAFEGADTGPAVFDHIARVLTAAGTPAPTSIGHRIVHGGPELRHHCRIDADVVRQLEAAVPFAPLHLPASLALIHSAGERYPKVPQVACFDTAFHATLPEVAFTLPISKDLRAGGLRRYGFHGLSCESILHQLGPAPERLIIAHLGNGASITAVRDGRSIDTSMGLTPSGGVVMGTRSGDLDPGVLIYLLRERGFDATTLEELIDHRSGLLGMSGLSGDMRLLHDAHTDPDAALAVAMFYMSVRKQIGAMIAVLGGIDMLVFTGGIGEHDDLVRTTICGGLQWAGLALDTDGGRVRVLPSQEDEQIARHTGTVIRAGTPSITCLPSEDDLMTSA